MEINNKQSNDLTRIQDAKQYRNNNFYIIVAIFVLINGLITGITFTENKYFYIINLFIIALLLFFWVYKSISQRLLETRIEFYPKLLGLAIGLFLVMLFLIAPTRGWGAIVIVIGGFILMTISIVLISVVYEIVRYKIDILLKNNLISDEDLNNAKNKDWTFERFISILLFLLSLLFLYEYLKLFIDNHKYVILLNNVSNLSDYGLGLLSLKSIFVSFRIFLIYLFIIISLISIVSSFRKLKIFSIFISVSVALLVFIFWPKIFDGSNPNIYFNTVYQKGSPNNGGAIDIIKTDKAIKSKDINLCSDVSYYSYRNYCIKMLSL